jgi:hypothetical protein
MSGDEKGQIEFRDVRTRPQAPPLTPHLEVLENRPSGLIPLTVSFVRTSQQLPRNHGIAPQAI